jgi:hypothetical protein
VVSTRELQLKLQKVTDTETIAAGQAAWQRLRGNATWEDWRAVGLALHIGREHALRVAKADKPFGQIYVRKFAVWLRQNELDGINKAVQRPPPDHRQPADRKMARRVARTAEAAAKPSG